MTGAPYIVPGEKPEPVPDSPQARAPEAAPCAIPPDLDDDESDEPEDAAPDGEWRRVDPDEIFEPGRSFRVDVSSGQTEVLDPPQPLVIDRSELTRFVNAMFAGLDPWGYVSLRAFPQRTAGKPLHIEAIRLNTGLEPVVDAAVRIAAKVCNGGEPGVFAPPVCTFADRKTARAADVHEGPAISIEIDAGELQQIVDRIALILGARPTITMHSGSLWADPETGGLLPKGHAHWRLAEPARGPEQLRMLRRARDIATMLAGGDPSATPPVHPMRWPGTWNLKTDRPVMARIVEENDSTIALADALAALEEAAQLANLTTPRNVPHLAQPDTTPADVAQIVDWLSFYPNTAAVQWNDWNNCAMAIHRVTGGSEAGFEAFRTWSATSPKHSDADCRARWDAITGSPATWIGANHLRRKASEHGWVEPTPEPPEGWDELRPPFGRPDAGGAEMPEPGPGRIDPNPPELPDLHVLKSDLPLVSQKLRDRLTAHPWMFERGRPARLVTYPPEDARPTEVPPFGVEAVIHAAHEVCRPYQVDHRGKRTNVTLPERVAKLYLALNGRWNLRPLHGICCSVLLGDDGNIHAHEGYHAPSGLWCTRTPTITVPDRPTKPEAGAALYRLREAMRTFTFKGAPLVAHDGNLVVDIEKPPGLCESAALCALLTGVTRASLPLAPGVMINAPALSGSGAGKGLLARMITAIAFGVAPKAGTAGHDEMELEKRIGAVLMRGDPVILLDNLNNTLLRSPQLESCLTEPLVSVRVFGKLEMQDIRTTALLLLTGNGLQASGDSARRYVYPTLEPPVDDPEQRKYAPGFLDGIFARRSELLSDCLTIWRYGRQQKLPRGKPFGSYERWTEWVRDTLLALGCADPVDTISEVRERDPARVSLAALFEAWASKHGGWVKADELDFTVRRLVDDKERPAAIRKRLNELIGTRLGGYELRGKADGTGKHRTWSYCVVQN